MTARSPALRITSPNAMASWTGNFELVLISKRSQGPEGLGWSRVRSTAAPGVRFIPEIMSASWPWPWARSAAMACALVRPAGSCLLMMPSNSTLVATISARRCRGHARTKRAVMTARDVAATSANTYAVADTGNNRVREFGPGPIDDDP
jgi:hypothetical protein